MTGGEAGLRRVVYVSRASGEGGMPMQATLDSILRAARRNNAELGVTGALLYGARRFAQVLEGPAPAVERIFETIQCDLRHDQVTVLEVSDPAARAFGAWSMAFSEAPAVDNADLAAADRLIGLLQAAIRNTDAAAA